MYSGEVMMDLKASHPSLPTAKFNETSLDDTIGSIMLNQSIRKDETAFKNNRLLRLKNKNHNSISYPMGMSQSLEEMLSSIKKTNFNSSNV